MNVLNDKAGRQWLLEKMRLSLDRPALYRRSRIHRRPYDSQSMQHAPSEMAYLSLKPNLANHDFEPLSVSNSSQTVWRMADFPTPGAPLIHIMPLPAHSPLRQIQLVTTSWTALRVSTWHFGGGYLAPELRRASNATFVSSRAIAVYVSGQTS